MLTSAGISTRTWEVGVVYMTSLATCVERFVVNKLDM